MTKHLSTQAAALTVVLGLALVYAGQVVYIWYLTAFQPGDILLQFHAIRSYGEENMAIVDDPDGGSEQVLRVFYPKGTHAPSNHPRGGAQFYSYSIAPRRSATLTYDVFFAENFDFVKGGKLPGLMGGTTRTCSGGRDAEYCFSSRFMFRREGDGEVYFYAAPNQTANFCDNPTIICNFEKGHSLGRGSLRFETGIWQTISQRVYLNTVGKYDGYLQIWVNNNLRYELKNLLFRIHDDVLVTGMFFSTFFGGSDDTWATPVDTYTYYRHFYITDEVDDEETYMIG